MSIQWDSSFESSPTNLESAGQGDDRIRELKVEIRERMTQGGHLMQDSDPTLDGRHATDVDGSGLWRVFASDHSTVAMQVSDSTIKPGSSVKWRTAADNPVTYQRRALVWTIPYAISSTGTDGVCFISLPCPEPNEGEYGSSVTVDMVEFRIAVRVPSSSATTLKVDLKRCAASDDPTDANFSSVLTTPLELASGTYEASTTSFVTGLTLATNDKFIIEITQTDSADPVEYLTATFTLRW